MIKRFLLICFAFWGLNFVLFAQNATKSQDSIKLVINGPFGGDMRFRPSYGVIPDARYNNIKKVNDLDSKKIAIGVVFPQVITVTNENFWRAKSFDYPYKFNVEGYFKTLIFSSPAQHEYNFKLFENKDVDTLKLKYNIWNGTLIISEKSESSELAKKYDVDYLILIIGCANSFFKSGGTGILGLYGYSDFYFIYAGHRICIFNLRTGKLLSNGYSEQVSADVIPLILKSDFKDFSEEQLNIVDKMMELRIANNFHQTFKLLGLE
jgi:hypothetical protein